MEQLVPIWMHGGKHFLTLTVAWKPQLQQMGRSDRGKCIVWAIESVRNRGGLTQAEAKLLQSLSLVASSLCIEITAACAWTYTFTQSLQPVNQLKLQQLSRDRDINHHLEERTHTWSDSFKIRLGQINTGEYCKITVASFLGTHVFRLCLWSECIPKSSCLIFPHLSLFTLANTMPLVPRRIMWLHCRRQTIYWHFASLNSTVSLPANIHLKQYKL